MDIIKEEFEQMARLQCTFTPEESAFLRAEGLRLIQEDDEALINYAVNCILTNQLAGIDPQIPLDKKDESDPLKSS